jgi:hypothetical protein
VIIVNKKWIAKVQQNRVKITSPILLVDLFFNILVAAKIMQLQWFREGI